MRPQTAMMLGTLLLTAAALVGTATLAPPRACAQTNAKEPPESIKLKEPKEETGALYGHDLYAYISNGKNPKMDWGCFDLIPHKSGKALYLDQGKTKTVALDPKKNMESVADPGVWYWVYQEAKGTRLWAFQINKPSVYGYVIYFNDSGDPTMDWKRYDLARRHQS